MNAKEIMAALAAPSETYQRDAMQAAMDHPEVVVPLLLNFLEQLRADPAAYCSSEDTADSFLPIYATSLLGHHRTREAHPLLIDLMSLPTDLPYDLFGDAIHSVCIVSLWKTSGGDPTEIIRLIENRNADLSCRSEAIVSLGYGLAEGSLTRQQVLDPLHRLFDHDAPGPDDVELMSFAAIELSRMWPGDSMKVLRMAFDCDLINPGIVGLQDVEVDLQMGQEACFASFGQLAIVALTQTPHEQLASWACFNRDRKDPLDIDMLGQGLTPSSSASSSSSSSSSSSRSTRKKPSTAERKRKRNQAKAARKKGRAKKKKKKKR